MSNPTGICKCGCGKTTTPRIQNNTAKGHVKGEYPDYMLGHSGRGKEINKPADGRFWDRVNRSGPNGCWEWTGQKINNGYGRIYVYTREVLVHRFSWELHNGPISEDLLVLHKCDNRICVNPDHLFLGTDKDNAIDRNSKGRRTYEDVKGENNKFHLLTENQVLEIRKFLDEGRANESELARLTGTHRTTINSIHKRETWKHI